MWYPWLLLPGIVIAILVIVRFARKRPDKPSTEQFTAELIRFPERALIDMPWALEHLSADARLKFVTTVDSRLEDLGGFRSRRDMLRHYNSFLDHPTVEELANFVRFLFHPAQDKLCEAITWEGRAAPAVAFLRLIDYLYSSAEATGLENLEKNQAKRILKQIRNKPLIFALQSRVPGRELSQRDRSILDEWRKLLNAMELLLPSKERTTRTKQTHKNKKRGKPPVEPSVFAEPKRIQHLISFRRAARQAYQDWFRAAHK